MSRAFVPLIVALVGCSLAPKYSAPALPVAASYPGAPTPVAERADDIDWQDVVLDASLRDLVDTALANSRDLERAALRIERARALLRIRQSDLLPQLDATAGYTISNVPEASSPVGQSYTLQQYRAGVQVTAFELDFFGRLRDMTRSERQRYLATEEAWRTARLSLISDVLKSALSERAAAQQIVLAQAALDSRQGSLDLAQRRFDGGVATELELRQAQVLVHSAQVAVAVAQRAQGRAHNALELLVGVPLDAQPPAGDFSEPLISDSVPVGMPSDLLSRRPDIRGAERALIGAHADIGVARAAFFPRIALTASAGSASRDLLGLFATGTSAWSFVPQLTAPLFAFGRNRAQLKGAKVDREIAVATYELAIQSAFREVADVLVARDSYRDEVSARVSLRQAQQARVDLSRLRYEGGVSGQLELLDAERSLLDADLALVEARRAALANHIDLFRVIGGGAAGVIGVPEQD